MVRCVIVAALATTLLVAWSSSPAFAAPAPLLYWGYGDEVSTDPFGLLPPTEFSASVEAFSPDGDHYLDNSDGFHLRSLMDSSDQQLFGDVPTSDWNVLEEARFAPDGQHFIVVYDRTNPDDDADPQNRYRDIFTVNADGSEMTEVLDWGGSSGVWLEDIGRDGRIYFSAPQSPTGEDLPEDHFYAVDADGSNLSEIEVPLPAGYHFPDQYRRSPDGTRASFVAYKLDTAINAYRPSVFVMNADGTDAHILVNDALGGTWDPDSLGMVYSTWSRWGFPNPELRRIELDGSNDELVSAYRPNGKDALYPQPSDLFPTPEFDRASVDSDREAYRLARQFQPILRFDEGEKWRPLSVERFFREVNPTTGLAVHNVCDPAPGSCDPLTTGVSALRSHADGSAFVDIGSLSDDSNVTATDFRSPNAACIDTPSGATNEVLDCNSGPATAIYFNAMLRSAGYNYLDYYFFYRYNESLGEDHRADWEGLTVAPSLTNPDTFDWVSFEQHGDRHAYTRDSLECDVGGISSCGDGTGRAERVWAYAAGGTHASYPSACTSFCSTTTFPPALESDHGGEIAWGANDDPASLVMFPKAGRWNEPSAGNWTDWPGLWTDPADGSNIYSPGVKRRFRCPWEGNPDDATGCAASRRRVEPAAQAAAKRCSSWAGGDVAVAVCSPRVIKEAVRTGRVGTRGSFRLRFRGRHRRKGAGRGIAQIVGAPLRPGEDFTLIGKTAADTTLAMRAVSGRWQASIRMTNLRLRAGGHLRVAVRRGRKGPKIIVTGANGRKLRNAIVYTQRKKLR
jgi:hypothetical protein